MDLCEYKLNLIFRYGGYLMWSYIETVNECFSRFDTKKSIKCHRFLSGLSCTCRFSFTHALTLQSLVITLRTTSLNIHMFHVDLRPNSDYFPVLH